MTNKRLLAIRILLGILMLGGVGLLFYSPKSKDQSPTSTGTTSAEPAIATQAPSTSDARPSHDIYQPRLPIVDTSGLTVSLEFLRPWDPTSLTSIRDSFANLGHRLVAQIDRDLLRAYAQPGAEVQMLFYKAAMLMYDGDAEEAYNTLTELRQRVEASPELSKQWLFSVIFFQGVAGMRRGENENCIHCLGNTACIFPIQPSAFHKKAEGSRLAIKHFTEYLKEFPTDPGVRWLLNLAYRTLGEHPDKVPREYLMTFEKFGSEANIGSFKNVGRDVGLDRFNEAGGAVMDDFDNDGLLDIVTTSWDATEHMAYFHNQGDGTFEDRTEAAGLTNQLGGLNLVQTDYNNDGLLDLFIVRGAWFTRPMRPSLLRNNGDGTFTDVTEEAKVMEPVNSISSSWADYDNDGLLDLFICCETGRNLLYRNRGDGTFEEAAEKAGVDGKRKSCKGAAWIDYDNDGYPDLFLTYMGSTAQLFHNNKDGTFKDVTAEMGISGPDVGFSCWAFDFDNDGWLDLFATSYARTLDDLANSIQGQPLSKGMEVTRLYRNLGGKKFQDVSQEMGVDKVFATMGSNFGDFSNDGYLDFYLGTGDPSFATLVPNRMFKNMRGKRFADMTTTSGTGQLQKGHGVACGDWRRTGDIDLFVELGGAVPGDRFSNALFQNPGGHGNNWLTVKLIGKKTNRAAIGARIKVVTAGENPLTVHRHVSSGSSFGGNPLEQHIGLAKGKSVATLEVFWPTSQTTQVFHDIAVNQYIEITEFGDNYRKLNWAKLAKRE